MKVAGKRKATRLARERKRRQLLIQKRFERKKGFTGKLVNVSNFFSLSEKMLKWLKQSNSFPSLTEVDRLASVYRKAIVSVEEESKKLSDFFQKDLIEVNFFLDKLNSLEELKSKIKKEYEKVLKVMRKPKR
jgi:hypothetical protein